MKSNELWLIWRNGDLDAANRSRYWVGTLIKKDDEHYVFRYNDNEEFDEAVKNGFNGFPGFEDLEQEEYRSEQGLFHNISVRLPKKERDDYLDVLNRYDLDSLDDEFMVLSRTKGRQITDNFEFVPAFDENKIEFDVAGVRHRSAVDLENSVRDGFLTRGAKLILEKEPDNEFDEFAVKVLLPVAGKQVLLGYVPRYYSRPLTKKLESGAMYSAVVARVDLRSKLRDEKISAVVRLKLA